MKKFDYIIPLGRNCEPSFQMNIHLGFVESFPFNWCYILDNDMLLEVLNNKKLLFSGEVEENNYSNMWLCKETNISFHAQRKPKEFNKFTGDTLKKEKDIELLNLKNKLFYLFNKLEKVWNTNKKQLYIITIDKEYTQIIHFVNKLKNILQSKTNNFSILIILPQNKKNNNIIDNDKIFFRYIYHFSPVHKVTDLNLCDLVGCENIFREFGVYKTKTEHKKYKFDENYNIFKLFYYMLIVKIYSFIYFISLKKSRKIKNEIIKYSYKLRKGRTTR